MEKAGSYQAMALKRQAWTLARLPYTAMLENIEHVGEDLPAAPGCEMCAVYQARLGKIERLLQARGALAELSKAVAQTSKAVSDTMRLQDFLKGLPDSRSETKHVTISTFMALLSNEQFAIFEGWIKSAQQRALPVREESS